MSSSAKQSKIVAFLWDLANLLWGTMPKSEHQNVVMPFTVLRRLDYTLQPTREKVLKMEASLKEKGLKDRSEALRRTSGFAFYNTCPFSYDDLLNDEAHIRRNLQKYIAGFSDNVQEIFQRFKFNDVIRDLDEVGRLYQVVSKFNEKSKLNLAPFDEKENPDGLNNHDMGGVFEELIHRYNEDINENPGEHYTPRDVIRLLTNLVLSLDTELAKTPGISRTIGDCCCGTGGMLSTAREVINDINPDARTYLFGQELNPRTWAVCRSDMMMFSPEAQDLDNIKLGSTLSNDQLSDRRFDYQFVNPPYGFKWDADKKEVEAEYKRGHFGRFTAGLPRISDGQLLFLQHMINHMNEGDPSYIGVVYNGSPLFTGDAGSGESEIRRWVLENDYLYALVSLPGNMFYNTPIDTYLWILTNHKPAKSKGKVMLFDASGKEYWTQRAKSVGDKRRDISKGQQKDILKQFKAYKDSGHIQIHDSTTFGYRKVQVERPLRLSFEVTNETLAELQEIRAFANLGNSTKRKPEVREAEEKEGRAFQKEILKELKSLPSGKVMDREIFLGRLDAGLKEAELKIKAPVRKAIIEALGERDEKAEICLDKNGDPEPDTQLRDHEYVPLGTCIYDYFEREVLPHVSDAWINEEFRDEQDGEVGKVGYEINFNRYFYQYQAPRSLEAIDGDLQASEKNIVRLLREVVR
jgi:type I restriction enzyme M protein